MVCLKFLFIVTVTVDDWLKSLLCAVSCKTVVVMTTEDGGAKVSQGPWGKEEFGVYKSSSYESHTITHVISPSIIFITLWLIG